MVGKAGNGAVAQNALKNTDIVHDVLQYILSTIFSKLPTLVESSQVNTLKEEELHDRLEMFKSRMEAKGLMPVFGEVPLS